MGLTPGSIDPFTGDQGSVAQVVGPFQDLGTDVHQEHVRRLPAKDHNVCRQDDIDEECRGRPGSNRFVSDFFFFGIESEAGFAPEGVACIVFRSSIFRM
jgi:hypothetical protein